MDAKLTPLAGFVLFRPLSSWQPDVRCIRCEKKAPNEAVLGKAAVPCCEHSFHKKCAKAQAVKCSGYVGRYL